MWNQPREILASADRWWRRHVPQFTWRALLKAGVALAVGGVVLALAVSYGGIYNIGASHQHPTLMTWFLELSMRRSVQVQSAGTQAPPLDHDELVPLGAAHFAGTCAICHAGPGVPQNPVFSQMLPSPPRLSERAPHWTAAQLHWMVLHGIQFSGMPAWPGKGREDEVWSTVAFLQALPQMTAAQYYRFANGNLLPPQRDARELVRMGDYQIELTACNRCHDTHRMPPVSTSVPRLAGQTETYLYRTLLEYKNDHRQSGIMEPVAAMLSEVQLGELARHYAQLASPTHRGAIPSPADVERGRELARRGDRERKVPACDSCHTADARADYPRLAGQSRVYQVNQLELWRRGLRASSEQGSLMAVIARRMTVEQVQAAAAYYASEIPAPDLAFSDSATGVAP